MPNVECPTSPSVSLSWRFNAIKLFTWNEIEVIKLVSKHHKTHILGADCAPAYIHRAEDYHGQMTSK